MAEPIETYAAFWAHYLRAHRRPATRALHYVGTASALALLAAAAILDDWRLALAAPIAGYGVCWLGHGAVEGNRPATFGHPFWSFASDLRMLGLFATGQLASHIERHLGHGADIPAP